MTMSAVCKPLPLRNRLRFAKNVGTFQLAQWSGKEPVLVYQMGKVGSTALAALINRVPGYGAVQVHRLMPDRTAEIRARFDAGERYYRDMRIEQWVYRHIIGNDRPVRIVTAVREPLAHSYSAFFQNLPRSTRGGISDPNAVDALRQRFLGWDDLGAALHWLDLEASRLTGCDLVAQPFDIDRGWSQVEQGRFSILILKAELDDVHKRAAIQDFLGHDPGAVPRANSAEGKAYAVGYQTFIDAVKLPASMAEAWADHRYTRHFYSEAEIRKAIARFSSAVAVD